MKSHDGTKYTNYILINGKMSGNVKITGTKTHSKQNFSVKEKSITYHSSPKQQNSAGNQNKSFMIDHTTESLINKHKVQCFLPLNE